MARVHAQVHSKSIYYAEARPLTFCAVAGHADGQLCFLECESEHIEGMYARPHFASTLATRNVEDGGHALVQQHLQQQAHLCQWQP